MLKLPPEEFLQLADVLPDSVPDEMEDPAWQQAWTEKFLRRAARIRAGNIEGIDADQVFSEQLERLSPPTDARFPNEPPSLIE